MKNLKEITEEKYYDMLEAVPPIYVSELDGEQIKAGFALGEAHSQTKGQLTYILCLKKDDKYYEIETILFTPDGKPILYTELVTYSRGNKAQSID